MLIEYGDLMKINALNIRCDADGNDFGFDTCCDYVESVQIEGDKVGVTVFVEPCGDITKWGTNVSEVLDWWIAVFKAQPEHWGYIEAGWCIYEANEKGLPDNPLRVFPVIVDAEIKKPLLK